MKPQLKIKTNYMNNYMAVRNSVLKLSNGEWLHFQECSTFKEAKGLANELNKQRA